MKKNFIKIIYFEIRYTAQELSRYFFNSLKKKKRFLKNILRKAITNFGVLMIQVKNPFLSTLGLVL